MGEEFLGGLVCGHQTHQKVILFYKTQSGYQKKANIFLCRAHNT